MVEGKLPIDLVIFLIVADRRQRDLFLAKPKQYLASTPEFLEFAEHQMKGILDAHIRIKLDRMVQPPAETHRQAESQFASLRLLANGFQRALPQDSFNSNSLIVPRSPSNRRSLLSRGS